jgi:hypothetical protein
VFDDAGEIQERAHLPPAVEGDQPKQEAELQKQHDAEPRVRAQRLFVHHDRASVRDDAR